MHQTTVRPVFGDFNPLSHSMLLEIIHIGVGCAGRGYVSYGRMWYVCEYKLCIRDGTRPVPIIGPHKHYGSSGIGIYNRVY
jgi:hypothetical protein